MTTPIADSILIFAGYTAIITLGQYVSMSSGILSVAHAALAGAGGYVGAVITVDFKLPLPVALSVGLVVGFALGLILGFLTVRLAPLVAGLMTLAFAEVMVVIAYNLDYLGGANGFSGVPLLTNTRLTYGLLVVIAFAVWRYDSSRLGYAARACRDDPRAAAGMGINVAYVKTFTFALGAAIAAVGGVVRVHFTSVQIPADLGFFQGVNYLMFAVLGGSYVVWGPIAGALGLTVLPELLRFTIAERYMIYGGLLTLIIVARPEGLIRRRALGVPRQPAAFPTILVGSVVPWARRKLTYWRDSIRFR